MLAHGPGKRRKTDKPRRKLPLFIILSFFRDTVLLIAIARDLFSMNPKIKLPSRERKRLRL
jgi:hypothetical protein